MEAPDILIVGGGPAGATAARLLAEKYSVLVLEKKPAGAAKLCGGLLAPAAQKALDWLGLVLPESVKVEPQLRSVRAVDWDSGLERIFPRDYVNIDRAAFDAWLLKMVPKTAQVSYGARMLSVEKTGKGWRTKFQDNRGEHTAESRFLIGADGALSLVRRSVFPKQKPSRMLLSLQQDFSAIRSEDAYQAHFSREVTPFYSWVVPKARSLSVGSAFAWGDQAHARFQLLRSLLQLKTQAALGPIKGAAILQPLRAADLFCGHDLAGLIGEAGGFISPSSAEGISYAMKSGALLAEALDSGLEEGLKRYSRWCESLKRNIFLKRQKAKLYFWPWVRKTLFRWGLGSI